MSNINRNNLCFTFHLIYKIHAHESENIQNTKRCIRHSLCKDTNYGTCFLLLCFCIKLAAIINNDVIYFLNSNQFKEFKLQNNLCFKFFHYGLDSVVSTTS